MIADDRRKAIYLLHEDGMASREIARRMQVARSTVQAIIAQKGAPPKLERSPAVELDIEELRRLYAECEGWIQRVHEKLADSGVKIAYPTLTRRLRELGISTAQGGRCDEVPDQPGAEMQHDTSPYWLTLGGSKARLIASLLYLRFSKRKYLRFYPAFNRFRMKAFFHEALTFWGYAAPLCVIDNTNLARLSGTGKDAVIVPEMAAFAERYGTRFRCHEVNHADRKAGEERGFYTTESNFFPGRSFASLEDLNAQAFVWATERMENRRQGKTRVIPAIAFEEERPYLKQVPAHLPAPFVDHVRGIDQYGYVPFQGNFYFVPGTGRGEVRVFEYAEQIKLYQGRELLLEYPLPPYGVKNEKFAPPGEPKPRGEPQRRRGSEAEERRLRALGEGVGAYLDFALPRAGRYRHEFIRKLLGLSRRMSPELFARSLERAREYRIVELPTIERIALLYFKQGEPPSVEIDESFTEREAYREGSFTDPPDLSIYG
jgi:transposase